MMDFLVRMFGDDAINYGANFTTILVNGGILYGAFYALVLRRAEFVGWIRKFYTALVELVAELREANRIAREKDSPPPPPAPVEPTEQAATTESKSEPTRPTPAPPHAPKPGRVALASVQEQAARTTAVLGKKRSRLPLITAAVVAMCILTLLAIYALSNPRSTTTTEPAVVEQRVTQQTAVSERSSASDAEWTYSVRPGDSCWRIAARASANDREALALCARLQALNPSIRLLAPRSEIQPGDELTMPGDVPRESIER